MILYTLPDFERKRREQVAVGLRADTLQVLLGFQIRRLGGDQTALTVEDLAHGSMPTMEGSDGISPRLSLFPPF